MATVLERPTVLAFGEAVSEFDRQRLSIFEGLIAELEAAVAEPNSADFGRIFAHAKMVLGFNDLQLSELLHVSRPSVNRWANGQVTPHAVMAEAVLKILTNAAKKQLRVLRGLQR